MITLPLGRRTFITVLGVLCVGFLGAARPVTAQSVPGLPSGFTLPVDSTQLVLGIADSMDSSRVTLSFHQREPRGDWQRLGEPWPGRLGKNGMVWGRGIHPVPRGVALKVEGDMRAPAGVFRLGGIWGDAVQVRKHPNWAYQTVGPRDLWVEDPKSPHYNRYLRLDHDPKTPWEKKQQMRLDDPAHKLKLFIAHNAPPNVVADAGSSIFFHIWRGGGSKATAGCTTMAESDLRLMIARLDPDRRPLYVLLAKEQYAALKDAWALP